MLTLRITHSVSDVVQKTEIYCTRHSMGNVTQHAFLAEPETINKIIVSFETDQLARLNSILSNKERHIDVECDFSLFFPKYTRIFFFTKIMSPLQNGCRFRRDKETSLRI